MKLTTKLILAFLFISLLSIGSVAIFTRAATNREFDKFINQRYQKELMEELEHYYEDNGSWQGLESRFALGGINRGRPLFFSIADESGNILVAGENYRNQRAVSRAELKKGKPIEVEDKIVGVLLFNPSLERDPMEDEFIRRMGSSIFFSAVGTIFVAFILGAILSRTITRPIRELTNASRQIASGKFDQRVPVRSRDEIGALAEAFNKMSSELARSSNLRKQMTADIAHELRTPLSLILGHAEAVHDGVLPPSKENFEIIREEAERLEKLVNDLRTLSLADAGELSVDFQPVDVNQLLADIHAHYLMSFSSKRVSLDLCVSPAPLKANLDPSRFAQALTNILENALRYTPEGGRVEMSARAAGDEIEIVIADSGEGVTPEEAVHLFDRFYRADESRARNDGGSGLGLAITKSIIEMHKGKIWAESEKGKGLRMLIRVPLLYKTK